MVDAARARELAGAAPQYCLDRLSECMAGALAGWEALKARAQGGQDGGGGGSSDVALQQLRSVTLDQKNKGKNVEVSRFCVSGSGVAFGNVVVEQERAFWEVEVVREGPLVVGVAQLPRAADGAGAESSKLDGSIGDKSWSWGLSSTRLERELKPKDVIGVFFDQRDVPVLKFSLNGEMLDESNWIQGGIRGDVRPAVSLQKTAIVRFHFDENTFKFAPSGDLARFQSVIPARQIL